MVTDLFLQSIGPFHSFRLNLIKVPRDADIILSSPSDQVEGSEEDTKVVQGVVAIGIKSIKTCHANGEAHAGRVSV
jgi:hypothetical protein